jgi:hypothetical protein
MRLGLRTPFFGMPEDAALLPEPAPGALDTAYEKAITAEVTARLEHFAEGCERHMIGCMGDGMTEGQAREVIPGAVKRPHPAAVEKGTEIALGFMQHQGENRTQRRAAVANFAHPEVSRRELWLQRQKQRRGKLDIETRRLQRKATK